LGFVFAIIVLKGMFGEEQEKMWVGKILT